MDATAAYTYGPRRASPAQGASVVKYARARESKMRGCARGARKSMSQPRIFGSRTPRMFDYKLRLGTPLNPP